MSERTSQLPTVIDVLHVVAPRGIVPSEDSAFADTVAFLRVQGHSQAIAETIGLQVRKFCQEKGIWSIVDGRRCLLLPHASRCA
jgi:hypothetical protein